MRTDRRVAAETKAVRTGFVPLFATGSLILALAALALPVRAETVIKSYGISTFGDLPLPADFKNLPYVNPDAPKGGEISQWAPGSFDSFNPYAIAGNAAALSSIFYESILSGTLDDISAAYCLLCETMEYPEDRSWVIFNLRRDVTFSDGSPMTAEDVLFSYELFRDKGIPEYRSVANAKFQSVEVLDPYRIKFTFTPGTPFRDMPAQAGGTIIFSKADYEANNRDLEKSSLEPFLGTGPYVLESFKPGQQIIYKRNPDYWGEKHPLNVGQNNFDRIRIEYFGDDNAAMEAFKAGVYTFRNESDPKRWATGYDFPSIAAGDVVKDVIPSGNIAGGQAIIFNLRRAQFQDPRVREALGLVFNFEWSNKALFYGLLARINSIWENSEMAATGTPTPGEVAVLQPLVDEGLLPASILTDEVRMASVSSEDRALDRKNLRAASALLDEAGWTVGDDGKRRNARGETLRMAMVHSRTDLLPVMNAYVENLLALGVDASFEIIDDPQLQERASPPNFDFDALPTTVVNGGLEPGGVLKQAWASVAKDNSSRNRMGYADPAVDRILDLVEAANSREELYTTVKALDRVLRSQFVIVPRYYKKDNWVAYYNMYERPQTLPPYALGELSIWWYNAEKADALKAKGVLK
ncbi:extracellular solute-binding protein [Tabrizicola sp.]|jgi:microcin C transport system substrate-binding protein|uniref:extracellular solute-binding protein n=1 Tax=Tabrizicola sp. TaxID=2005166 RepID=UPI000BCCDFA8|nr:extracellular solute-binding protein [Tabrizicola sp.]MBY0349341.1 extracellular solute-binding protein [Tabrizicola sp.]MDK2774761.1 extracellular solute-binding protein [Tabrizicola sp.]OYX22161.1 MAG: ABC transporter substrate-binding protein [Rhodobacterales bacterium 32-66-9]